jgi:hypothetical protein
MAVMTRQFVTLLVGGALAVGWLSGSMTRSADPAQAGGAASSRPRPVGSPPTIVQQSERLRQHMAQPPQPGRGRNPFLYGSRAPLRPSPSRGDRENMPAVLPPQPIAPPAPHLPVFKLTGMASTTEGGASVLTAILNDNGAMVFVKAGDKLSNGYSVVRVEETSVTLVDADGVTQTIRLP